MKIYDVINPMMHYLFVIINITICVCVCIINITNGQLLKD